MAKARAKRAQPEPPTALSALGIRRTDGGGPTEADRRRAQWRREQAEAEARNRAERNREALRLSTRAVDDPEVAAILDRHGIYAHGDPARTAARDDWHEWRDVPAAGRWGDAEKRVVQIIAAEVAALDRTRLEAKRASAAPKPAPKPVPAPEPKPEPEQQPRRPSSGPGFGR